MLWLNSREGAAAAQSHFLRGGHAINLHEMQLLVCIIILKYLKRKVAYLISDNFLATGYVNKVEFIL